MTVAYSHTYGSLSDPLPSPVQGRTVQSLYAIIDITTAFANSDTADVGYLPKGAIPIGGYLACDDIDTGTETFDMDLGITDNGVDGADSDFFVNGGVFSGDAVTDRALTNCANWRAIGGKFPVRQFGAKTLVQIVCNAAANAGGTGFIEVRIDYLMPGVATS